MTDERAISTMSDMLTFTCAFLLWKMAVLMPMSSKNSFTCLHCMNCRLQFLYDFNLLTHLGGLAAVTAVTVGLKGSPTDMPTDEAACMHAPRVTARRRAACFAASLLAAISLDHSRTSCQAPPRRRSAGRLRPDAGAAFQE